MSFQQAAAQAKLAPMQGKGAVDNRHRQQIGAGKAVVIVGSINLDKHFQQAEPNANRWDYAVGFKRRGEFLIWIECHPASSAREVAAVIKKLDWLKAKLALPEFSKLAGLTRKSPGDQQFCWLYRGSNALRAGGKEEKRLAQHGMRLPQRRLEI